MTRLVLLLLIFLAACSGEPAHPWTIVVEEDGTLVDPRGGERRVLADDEELVACLRDLASEMPKVHFDPEGETGPLVPDAHLLVRCAPGAPAERVAHVLASCARPAGWIWHARLRVGDGPVVPLRMHKQQGTHGFDPYVLHLFTYPGPEGPGNGVTLAFPDSRLWTRVRALAMPSGRRVAPGPVHDDADRLVAGTPDDVGLYVFVGARARVETLHEVLAAAERAGRSWWLFFDFPAS